MPENLHFKVSSALKNILGKDLINDDLIAIFELVKNSYDAHANRVEIIFQNIGTTDAKIIISDDGKGMNYKDLVEKWLFLAYSAKTEGTEEDSYNYRDRIKTNRAYAGAKGIGRFSCDRLGSNLFLKTIKDEPNAKEEYLYTDWEKFEGDLKDEFINIDVLHESKELSAENNAAGTTLEITNLRSEWNRDKFLNLKGALAKLINPNAKNNDSSFKIELTVESELANDNTNDNYYRKVNGPIENLIFETLDWKTTKITSEIESNVITTTLYEGGKMIYSIKEKNTFDKLNDISCTIYFLNRSAKATFSRRMGVQPIEYGHILVYKNGLRIYPYGERGADPLKMDNRKSQGHSRYLGTREVIGTIEISGDNDDLRETSSRGDGFIKTQTYFQLENWFYVTLRRLEKYGIDVIDWGNITSDNDFIDFDSIVVKNQGTDNERVIDVNKNLTDLILRLTNSQNIESFELAPEIFEILRSKQNDSANSILQSIRQEVISGEFDTSKVIQRISEAEQKIQVLNQLKNEAETETFKTLLENEALTQELNKEIANKLFDDSILGREKEVLLTLQHQITHTASNISWSLDDLTKSINENASKEDLLNFVKDISLEVQKIVSASRFVTKANFNTEAVKIEKDLVLFIDDYVKNIYEKVDSYIHSKRKIDIKVHSQDAIKYVIKFRPLEITVMLDNLFTNSRKVKATKIDLSWTKDKDNIILTFKDNGPGIPSENLEKIFDFKFSTTDGSGIGLFHARQLIEKYNGTIHASDSVQNGAEFILKFPI